MVNHKTKSFSPKNILDFVLKEERRSSVVILVTALIALLIANSSWSNTYFAFFNNYLTLGDVTLNIRHWINEGLMALFFLVVGLEVKREFIDGELKTWRKASFPVFAAIGGMIVPALLFSYLNPYAPQGSGWAIPMATDIAVAVGVIGLLGKRIPKSLRVFLLTLAIVDDIGAILVIGLFYNQPTNTFAVIVSLTLILALALIRKQKHWPVGFLLVGFALWYCLLLAGVSATIVGVVIAFLMPLKRAKSKAAKLQTSELVEDFLIPFTSFVVVPLFIFANAGINISGITLKGNGSLSVFIGVLLGLTIGKPVGILLACWLGNLTRITQKPKTISWSQLLGVGFLAGIGFTISLLIAGLAYEDSMVFQNAATLGIFTATVVSGLIGLGVLSMSKTKTE